MPADHGGVGADRLHEGLSHPLQGWLVLRLPYGALLLRGHRQGEHIGPPGEKQGAAAQDQVVDHLVQSSPPVGRQVVQRPVLEQGKQLLLRGPAEGGVLGQRAEDIVAQPLVPGHPQQIAHRHRARPVSVEVHPPLHIVRTALKHLPQGLQRQRPVKAGLPSGMRSGVCPLRLQNAHGVPSLLPGSICRPGGVYPWFSAPEPSKMA